MSFSDPDIFGVNGTGTPGSRLQPAVFRGGLLPVHGGKVAWRTEWRASVCMHAWCRPAWCWAEPDRLPALPKILPKSTSCSSPTTSSTGSTQVREVPKRAGAASQPKEHFGLRNKTLWRLFLVSYKTRQPVQTGSSPLTHNPGWEGPIAPSINTVRWPPKASVIVECRPEQRGGSSAHPQPGVPASAAAPGWVHGDFV